MKKDNKNRIIATISMIIVFVIFIYVLRQNFYPNESVSSFEETQSVSLDEEDLECIPQKKEGLFLKQGYTGEDIGNVKMHNNLIKFFPFVKEASIKYDVPIDLIYAIILEESRGGINAESKTSSAVGPMQLEKKFFLKLGNTIEDLFDPRKNILLGTEYLSDLLRESANEYEALGRYGKGETGWKKLKENSKLHEDVASSEEAIQVLLDNEQNDFISKMLYWRDKFNEIYYFN